MPFSVGEPVSVALADVAFVAKLVVTVDAKLASSANAAANSLSVSKLAGAPSSNVVTAAFTSAAALVALVAASDAFFPFSDGINELTKFGVSAIIQPGGSINDKEVIKAADKANIVMAFTGTRHFRH